MKKTNKLFALAAASILALSFASCEMLQDSLSSEMTEKVTEETGKLTISSKTWYYNSDSSSLSTLASSDNTSTLKIDSTSAVKAGTSGMKVSFIINTTDSDGNSVSLNRSGEGYISGDGKTVYVVMQPVLKVLADSSDKTGKVEVKVSGLVGASGDQKGRTVAAFDKTIVVSAMWSGLSADLSTLNSTVGTKLKFATNGTVSVDSDSKVLLNSTALNGETSSDFTLSADSSYVYVTINSELLGKKGTISLTLTGLKNSLYGTSFSQKVTVTASSAYITSFTADGDPHLMVASSVVTAASPTTITIEGTDLDWSGTSGDWWLNAYTDSSWSNEQKLSWQTNTYYKVSFTDSTYISAAKSNGIYIAGLSGLKGTLTIKME